MNTESDTDTEISSESKTSSDTKTNSGNINDIKTSEVKMAEEKGERGKSFLGQVKKTKFPVSSYYHIYR